MTFIKGMRPANLRQWTPEEDDLMRLQAEGKLSMRQLEKAIHASRDSINLRMEMLGVKPFIKYVLRPRASPRARPRRSNKSPVVGNWEPGDEVNYIASYEGAERELKRLHMYHGYRRYEELNLEIKPRVKT